VEWRSWVVDALDEWATVGLTDPDFPGDSEVDVIVEGENALDTTSVPLASSVVISGSGGGTEEGDAWD
jgi:hypothetical protein